MLSAAECAKLEVYPLNDGYICSINIKDTGTSACSKMVQTVVILDRSGSMGSSVRKIVNDVLPTFFNLLDYRPDDTVHLITFDSVCVLLTRRVCDFASLNIDSRGCTIMTPAVHQFKELFATFDMSVPVRVLTISDGVVHDPETTKSAGEELQKFISDFQTPINSQAMRLFTSQVDK